MTNTAKMTKAQRNAILEAHGYRVNHPNGIRDGHIDAGRNRTRYPMIKRMIANGHLDAAGRVILAGLTAAGVMDAIEAEADAEDDERCGGWGQPDGMLAQVRTVPLPAPAPVGMVDADGGPLTLADVVRVDGDPTGTLYGSLYRGNAHIWGAPIGTELPDVRLDPSKIRKAVRQADGSFA
jgi:hypothetical protein